MAHARFTLGDPATDGLDFLLGDRTPHPWHGVAWRTLVFAAILLALLAGVVTLGGAGTILPMVTEAATP